MTPRDTARLVELVAEGRSDPSIADALDVSPRTVARWRKRLALAPGWHARPLPPHGTRSRYNHHRCRCVPCTDANTAYRARTRAYARTTY